MPRSLLLATLALVTFLAGCGGPNVEEILITTSPTTYRADALAGVPVPLANGSRVVAAAVLVEEKSTLRGVHRLCDGILLGALTTARDPRIGNLTYVDSVRATDPPGREWITDRFEDIDGHPVVAGALASATSDGTCAPFDSGGRLYTALLVTGTDVDLYVVLPRTEGWPAAPSTRAWADGS